MFVVNQEFSSKECSPCANSENNYGDGECLGEVRILKGRMRSHKDATSANNDRLKSIHLKPKAAAVADGQGTT